MVDASPIMQNPRFNQSSTPKMNPQSFLMLKRTLYSGISPFTVAYRIICLVKRKDKLSNLQNPQIIFSKLPFEGAPGMSTVTSCHSTFSPCPSFPPTSCLSLNKESSSEGCTHATSTVQILNIFSKYVPINTFLVPTSSTIPVIYPWV